MFIKPQHGFAMVEVLVTMIIMALGTLGISAMLLQAHKANSSSYLKQQALQVVYNMLDKMKANRQAVVDGRYNFSNLTAGTPVVPAMSTNCANAPCTASQLASYDIVSWLNQDVSLLPAGSAAINAVNNSGLMTVTITVQWNDSPAQTKLGAIGTVSPLNANLVQYSLETLI
ncbi:MAG: type IV pilus modification protein PilV [Legionellaceae bacterium]|nr:type IV pilus modification protein PilV [Legionellaceae bacterium]HCA89057.1 type IV pilus modification protein PilV [Legionellales bacterium]|tara:strand:+ start:1098 stop:1613 length:516 start_codon:yes stop_codon:yes gene_type:complete